MIRAIIIDDEGHCLKTLRWKLGKYCSNIDLLEECSTPAEGLAAIRSLEPDLVFLDIEMPEMNGFELLQSLDEVNFEVIFTTAYNDFAVRAFKVSAVDYLMKPINKDELILAVSKVENKTNTFSSQHINVLRHNLATVDPMQQRIAVPTVSGLELIEWKNIMHCQSYSNYTIIHFTDGTKMTTSKTLKETEDVLLQFNFFRIHNSHLVNLAHITSYSKGQGGYVVLTNGSFINVSRSRKEGLLALLSANQL